MRTSLLLACLAVATCHQAAAEESTRCQVHVILFVPSDVEPPGDAQERIDQVVDYADAFFAREIARWGHKDVVSPFRRTEEGHAEVQLVRGKQATSHYKPVTVRAEVMDGLREQNRITNNRQIWWILVYVGKPPAKFDGCLGGFGPQIGGWAVCNLDTTPGNVTPTVPLGSNFLEQIQLKALLHELGHGFQLPHIGPLLRDAAGNTLMGPTHYNFKRVARRDEDRVYLSEAEATLLATHPAFRGVADNRADLSKFQVEAMEYKSDPRRNTITVSGRVHASQPARYAFVADESDARPGDYWTKTYVGPVKENGAFEVTLTEPAASKGKLRTWFVFEDGTVTGNGKLTGYEEGVRAAYTYSRREWMFE